MAYGVWRMAYGVWRMAYGAQAMVLFGQIYGKVVFSLYLSAVRVSESDASGEMPGMRQLGEFSGAGNESK